jgi:predicted aconitase with swiveling domain
MCLFRYMENTRNALRFLHRVDTFRILAGAGQVNAKGGDVIAADSGGMGDTVAGRVARLRAARGSGAISGRKLAVLRHRGL